MSKLELVIMAGKESKEFLASLTATVDKLEKLYAKKPAADAEESLEETLEEEDVIEASSLREKATKGGRPAKAKVMEESFLEEDVNPEDTADEDANMFGKAEEETPSAKKAAKKDAFTYEDMTRACQERIAATSLSEAKGILRRKFNVSSITGFKKPEEFAAVIKAMALPKRN